MKPTERIAELEKENASLKEQVAGMQKKLAENAALGIGRGKSKSKLMAEEALKLLQEAGSNGVPLAEFAKLNPKYPSDVAFYLRSILKVDLKTVRKMEGGTRYMLPEHFQAYQAGLAQDKAKQEAAKAEVKAEAKESLRQTPAQVSPAVAAGAAKTGTRTGVLA